MDLSTIEVPSPEAKVRLAEYEELREEQRTAEDRKIMSAYRAAARGNPILRLSETVTAGGFFDNGLPRIAVVRAHAKWCWVRRRTSSQSGHEDVVFGDEEWVDNRGARVGEHTVRVTIPEPILPPGKRMWGGRTMTPLIPPQYRPSRGRLNRFHVLWEVEKWDLTPPRDPALLRYLIGDLWSVLATWDLTPLERAVLFERS